MKINIPMAYGESLKPEVLKGLAVNEVEALIFSSQNNGESKDQNKAYNISYALDTHESGDFILMDSDVVLPANAISEINEALCENPVVTIPTKTGHQREMFPNVMPHAVMAIREELVDELKKYLYKDGCFVCAFLKDYKPFVLWNVRGSEV